jgi:hypothetical protein
VDVAAVAFIDAAGATHVGTEGRHGSSNMVHLPDFNYISPVLFDSFIDFAVFLVVVVQRASGVRRPSPLSR